LRARDLGFVVLLLACRRETVQKDRTEPWAAPGVSASASSRPEGAPARRVRYRLEQGKVEVELPAKSARPRGSITPVRAELEIDPAAPERTAGVVELDLGSLSMLADDGSTRDAARSTRALEWLGLGSSVGADARESGRKASFIVRSVERKAAGTWLVRGELALAGVRAPETVDVSVSPALDAVTDAPERLQIRSVSPLVVTLSTHDIRPRDHHGAPVARDLELFGQKVGRDARVSFELTLAKQE
jgi:polyisoprenoid-binding protein YceI